MIIDSILFLTFKDLALLTAMLAVFVFVAGSLFHFIICEREYYEWSKNQVKKPVVKSKRKTATKITKRPVTPRPTRKARAQYRIYQ